MAIVLDLSAPAQIWVTLETLLTSIRGRVDRILSDLTAKDSRLPQHLKKKAWSKYGEDHPDKDLLDPCPFNITIIGSKYDLFQDFEPEKRKIICKTIRFVAHVNGAGVLFTSDKVDSLVHRCRALVGSMAFKSSASRSVAVDHMAPLIVPAASDTLSQIGAPPIDPEDIGKVKAKSPMDLWRSAYSSIFPADMNVLKPQLPDDPAANPKFADAVIDSCRAQKDEELERYRKQAERKARELAQKQAASSIESESSSDSQQRDTISITPTASPAPAVKPPKRSSSKSK